MTYDNEQADKLVSFATPEEQRALLHNNAGSLCQLWKLLVIALLLGPYIFDPSHKVWILMVYNLMNYDKWM